MERARELGRERHGGCMQGELGIEVHWPLERTRTLVVGGGWGRGTMHPLPFGAAGASASIRGMFDCFEYVCTWYMVAWFA